MSTARLEIASKPLSSRPFRGIGAEMDAYIFDATNRDCGVAEQDHELIERRVKALRPAVSRLFVEVAWFNPSLDGTALDWTGEGFRNLVRQLRLLGQIGAEANLVLFSPFPKKGQDAEPAVRAMAAAVERLVRAEGCSAVRWLTLWNEPDSLFWHDSPLYRRIFGADAAEKKAPWSEYVRLNRLAHELLAEKGLAKQVRMMVADTVWGAPMRRERLALSLEAFYDLDVAYGYHNYNPENLRFYEGNPDYAYAGMAQEAAEFRALLGPDRELVLWEFNTAGEAGFSSHYAGVGPGGEDRVSSLAGAADVADKVVAVLGNGIDGCCLWCLHDVIYMGNVKIGPMPYGLWRYKHQQWLPRPLYHYYSALMGAFRPGAVLHAVGGCPPGVRGVAARAAGGWTLALVNTGAAPAAVEVDWPGAAERLRIAPDVLPVACDLPVSAYVPQAVADRRLALELQPLELTVCRNPPA